MNEKKPVRAKLILIYLTITVIGVGLLTTGLGFVVDIVERDHAIVDNKSGVVALQREVASLKQEVKELNTIIVRMDKQLVAISTHLKVAIIQDD